MAARQRDAKKGDEKKRAIREAAYQCFRDLGYHKTTVEKICQLSHCSKGSFYWYYKSKHEVFIDILMNWSQEVFIEILKQFESAISQEDYVDAIETALYRELKRGRMLIPLWLEFTVRSQHDEAVRETLAKFYRRARSAIAELLGPFCRDIFSEEEVMALSATIFGAFTGLLTQELADQEDANAHRFVSNMMPLIRFWTYQLQAIKHGQHKELLSSTK